MNPNLIPSSEVVYPESDGVPMSDNTKQFRWIITLATNLASLFRHRADVFVSGNQFWYPVEGEPSIVASPDVYVVFGRPKGDRPSYKQWEEDDTPMTVVFEVLSPSNTRPEMIEKFGFYEDYGVEEYYIYDPDYNTLQGFQRQGDSLLRIRPIHEHTSDRLGIQFDLEGEELVVRYPDGRPFLTREDREDEIERETASLRDLIERAERETEQARSEAEQARGDAEQVRRELERASQRALRLAELSDRAMQQQATPEELDELRRLIEDTSR